MKLWARAKEHARRLGYFAVIELALAAAFAALVWQVARRVAFPWDLIIWSESPFMSNMLKLHAGQPLYSAPADANSFVYAPALEYLTYGLLRPFGLHLDIRACRVVCVACGVAAALVASSAMGRLAFGSMRRARVALFLVFVLVLFKNLTADVPHPDNLHMLHFALTFYLGVRALEDGGFGWALAAVVLAGMGVLVKQPALTTGVGAVVGLALSRRWSGRQLALLIGAGVVSTAAAVVFLWAPEHSRFWTLEILLRHPLDPVGAKLLGFLSDIEYVPYRLFVWVLGGWGMVRWWRAGASERRALVLLSMLGVTGALPSLAAYFKVMGAANNLAVLDLWLLLAATPLVPGLVGEPSRFEPPVPGARAWYALAGSFLVLSLVPTRARPAPELYRYAREIDAAVHDDVAAGKRVLVGHGAMFQIRAGERSPLLDRANSVLELAQGGAEHLAGTRARLAEQHYDRVYQNSYFYDSTVHTALSRTYHTVSRVAQVSPLFTEYRWGWQFLSPTVQVMEPRSIQGLRNVSERAGR